LDVLHAPQCLFDIAHTRDGVVDASDLSFEEGDVLESVGFEARLLGIAAVLAANSISGEPRVATEKVARGTVGTRTRLTAAAGTMHGELMRSLLGSASEATG
jgi:hypothetical protein